MATSRTVAPQWPWTNRPWSPPVSLSAKPLTWKKPFAQPCSALFARCAPRRPRVVVLLPQELQPCVTPVCLAAMSSHPAVKAHVGMYGPYYHRSGIQRALFKSALCPYGLAQCGLRGIFGHPPAHSHPHLHAAVWMAEVTVLTLVSYPAMYLYKNLSLNRDPERSKLHLWNKAHSDTVNSVPQTRVHSSLGYGR